MTSAVDVLPGSALDVLRDVYMTQRQREALARLERLVASATRVAGPRGDRNIGWRGFVDSDMKDYFKCEFCSAMHLDSEKMQHSENCAAVALWNALSDVLGGNEVTSNQSPTDNKEG